MLRIEAAIQDSVHKMRVADRRYWPPMMANGITARPSLTSIAGMIV